MKLLLKKTKQKVGLTNIDKAAMNQAGDRSDTKVSCNHWTIAEVAAASPSGRAGDWERAAAAAAVISAQIQLKQKEWVCNI